MERERVKSTALGANVAFPHARVQMGGATVALNIGFHKAGVELGGSRPTHVFFVILSAPSAQSQLLSVMAQTSRLAKMTDFLPRLMAGGGLDLYKILMEEEGKLP
jgi:mannitol/fructose-specific phosphotransferase system IIA component (Ntr-type)